MTGKPKETTAGYTTWAFPVRLQKIDLTSIKVNGEGRVTIIRRWNKESKQSNNKNNKQINKNKPKSRQSGMEGKEQDK